MLHSHIQVKSLQFIRTRVGYGGTDCLFLFQQPNLAFTCFKVHIARISSFYRKPDAATFLLFLRKAAAATLKCYHTLSYPSSFELFIFYRKPLFSVSHEYLFLLLPPGFLSFSSLEDSRHQSCSTARTILRNHQVELVVDAHQLADPGMEMKCSNLMKCYELQKIYHSAQEKSWPIEERLWLM